MFPSHSVMSRKIWGTFIQGMLVKMNVSGGLEFLPGQSYYFLSPSIRTAHASHSDVKPQSESGTASQSAERLSSDPCRSVLRLAVHVGGLTNSSDTYTPPAPAGVRVNIPRSLDYTEYSDHSSASRDNRETSGISRLPLHVASHRTTTSATSTTMDGPVTRRKEEGAGHLKSSGRGLGPSAYWLCLLMLWLLARRV
jgi:hypothetical protein